MIEQPEERSDMEAPLPLESQTKLEFAWKVHAYTLDEINHADTKAAFFFASYSTVLAAVYAAKLHHRFTELAANQWGVGSYASVLAFVLLAVGILCAFWALTPRLWNKLETGLIFWENIQAHGIPTNFWNALKDTSVDRLAEHVTQHLFILGQIARRKFVWVTLSASLGLAGVVIGAVVLLFQ